MSFNKTGDQAKRFGKLGADSRVSVSAVWGVFIRFCNLIALYSRAQKRRIISSLPAFEAMRAAWLTM
jgi:hypothetical protein